LTYLQFHLVFILPPLLLLGWRVGRTFPALGRRAPVALPLILLVAFVYTTPWDNYLVWKEVWGYPPDRVLARIGYVPVEEYMFFLLQPGIAGMLFYRLLARMPSAAPLGSPGMVRTLGALPWIIATGVGIWLLGTESGTYMGLILAWAAPVVALQWLFMGPAIWRLRKAVFPAILFPTLYLWVADWYAISQGIWYISERFTFGVNPFGLPVEEATFFLITNVLVVFGVVLFLAPGLPHLAAQGSERALRERSPRGVPAGGMVLALALGMVACEGAPQGTRGGGGGEAPMEERGLSAQASDRLIVPGERVGMLTSQTSEEALRVMVAPGFIQRAEIPVGEGFCYPGTVLFPDSPDRVEVTWQDEGRLSPAVVRIEGVGATWRTPSGTGVGATLREMEEANGGPFLFLGFGWDYGGRISDWMGGAMAPPVLGERPGLVVILDSDSLGVLMEREDPLVRDLAGDHAIRSDRPGLDRMGIRVVGLEVALGPEPAAPVACVGPDGIGAGVGSVAH
jgi:lycopene beta-cyclase